MTAPYSEIIADSISPQGHRITTIRETYWRPVLAERNTHQVQVKNSASSRARSLKVTMKEVRKYPAKPLSWPAEQRGMSGGAELTGWRLHVAQRLWWLLSRVALVVAWVMWKIGLHKSVVNRILEPWMMHTSVITATAWQNYFDQRCHPDAQPEIRASAELTKAAYDASIPEALSEGEWHLPFITDTEHEFLGATDEMLCKISASRCAQTSYGRNGTGDIEKDLKIYARLVDDQLAKNGPIHWSPLAHVAMVCSDNIQDTGPLVVSFPYRFLSVPLDHLPRVGPMTGWLTFRTVVETQMNKVTYR